MSQNAIERAILQTRNVSESQFAEHCQRLIHNIGVTDRETDKNALAQLFLLIQCSNHGRRIPKTLQEKLSKVLFSPGKMSTTSKVLSSVILKEMLPESSVELPLDGSPLDENQVPFILLVTTVQSSSDTDLLHRSVPLLIKETGTSRPRNQVRRDTVQEAQDRDIPARGQTERRREQSPHRDRTPRQRRDNQPPAQRDWDQYRLPPPTRRGRSPLRRPPTLEQHRQRGYERDEPWDRHHEAEEQKHIINSQIVDWLKNASLQQAPNPYSRGLFRKDTNEEPVSEIDGVVTKNMFTPLCIGQYFKGDQLLNVYSFSMLRQWLAYSLEQNPSDGRTETGNETVDSTFDSTVQFCLRILEQCDRKPKVPSDQDLQLAALVEAVSLLDCVCLEDASCVPKVIEQMKSIGNKLSVNQCRAMIPLMQFFLNHSDAVVHDAFQLYNRFFDVVIDANYASPTAAFETMTFIRNNISVLCYRTPLLQKYFPNILKILAWNPRTFMSEVVNIFPAFLSPTTSLEVVHSLLDLPCLSAALELLRQGATRSENTASHVKEALDKLSNQRYKPMYTYILRNQSGFGDTIDRLGMLHEVLGGLKSHPRVVMCAEAVPVLLKLAFRVIFDEGDKFLAGNLVSVLLERSGLLYGTDVFTKPVKKILSSQLVVIFRKYPDLVMDQFSELLEFVGSIRNINGRQDFFEHVVWVVGEYLSTSHDSRCKPENISAMYEALEAVSYEGAGLMQSSSVSHSDDGTTYTPSLLTSLMSAVAKLASRSQDLIPRVMLCLTKLGQLGQGHNLDEISRDALKQRSSELLNLMKLPHIAAVILTPPAEIDSERWHKDNLALPVLLQTTNDILQTKAL